ncbi:asparaginase [Sediminibacillus halophilus]|uniref:Asparaginase n=1 Tax=Sediminibacillus halophilus TaxID=482461 RepID=A0A1G9U9N0_9BACI|nr:asparaginase [Sediminibacillus halophilus]SDM56677.1 asparaginase [Sediminibacillus halophilus]
MQTFPTIAEDFRANSLENVHQGSICIVDENKQVIYEKGLIDYPLYFRSAMKPIQAIPVFSTDIVNKYQLTKEEAALFTASQRGEEYHQKGLENLLGKLDIPEDLLICGKSYPLNEEPKQKYIWNHKPKRRLLHNCSGKHLGFLAYAREKGYDLHTYGQLEHPLQQEILNHVKELSEIPQDKIITGIDGCGVPVHGIPLRNMAISYLKFVAPEQIPHRETANAVTKIGEVMNAHPEIVASHHFICTALLEDNNIIAKGGAQGVYCLALKEEKISIALKVLSGTELIWPLLVAEILTKLNYKNQDTIKRLLRLRSNNILNDSGVPVGETKIYL